MCNVLRLQQTPCIPSERKSRAARPQTFSPPSSVASAFKERKKCFCKIKFCVSLPSPPFRPLNWSTSAVICTPPQFFGICVLSDSPHLWMTQQMNPVHSAENSSCLLYTFPPHLHQIWKVALGKYKIYSRKIALPVFFNYVQGHVVSILNSQWSASQSLRERAKWAKRYIRVKHNYIIL